MKIDKYGIVLESLTLETAGIIRVWRNSPGINFFMDYQQEISVDQQRLWFAKIQKESSHYFLIRKDLLPIGMIHIEKIDKKDASAKVGLFIGESSFQGTGVALAASICLLELAFESLNLKKVLAKVKNDNTQAIAYNQMLGFEKDSPFNEHFSYWILSSERFRLEKQKLIKYLQFIE